MSDFKAMSARLQEIYKAQIKRVNTGESSTREEYEEMKALQAALYDHHKRESEDAHEKGDACDWEHCQECCDHEYDPDEGMMCINCDAEYPY